MDIKGQKVTHKTFGNGIVTMQTDACSDTIKIS